MYGSIATSIGGRWIDPRGPASAAVVYLLVAAGMLLSEAARLARATESIAIVAASHSLRFDMPVSPYPVSEVAGAVIQVPLLIDMVPEADREFEGVLLRSSTHSFLRTNAVRTVMIQDDDPGVIVEAVTNRVREDAQVFVATVRKDTNSPRATSVGYRVDGVTATAGEDFVAVSGRLDFGPLETRKTIEIPILSDYLMEGPESFAVTLTDSTGVPLGKPARLQVTVLDTSHTATAAVAPVRFDAGPVLMVPQADGRVVVGGMFHTLDGLPRRAIGRLLCDGSLDPEFRRSETSQVVPERQFNPWGTLSIDSRGRIIVAGQFLAIDGVACPGLFRLQPDGSLDRSFAPGHAGRAFAAEGLAGGGVVAAGATNRTGGNWFEGVEVFKLTETGSFSPEFQPARLNWQGGNVNYGLHDLKVKEIRDGRLLITHTTVPGEPSQRWPIVRLQADGKVDSTYTPPAGSMLLRYAAPMADGSVFVTTRTNVCPFVEELGRCGFLFRLKPDGSIDARFRPPTGRAPITALATYPDGRLLVAYDDDLEHDPIAVERLLADGTVDPSFGPVSYGVPTVWCLAALPDGSAFAGAVAGVGLNQLPWSQLFLLPAVAAPGIAEARRLAGGGLRLAVECAPGVRYTLEASGDLARWHPVETRTASNPGIVFETLRGDVPEFYRVRREAE
ncbi:MAG: hypothetical protein JNK85_16930 [Verrucomicrobiales bacterium]|nr:hypothetical protein [Verrucomicrobiales bacterium]